METHEEFKSVLNMGRAIAKEHFAEIEMSICKGKRLFMKQIVSHLEVCLRTARKDLERGVSTESVLETTLGALESMKDVYTEELNEGVKLISKEALERNA